MKCKFWSESMLTLVYILMYSLWMMAPHLSLQVGLLIGTVFVIGFALRFGCDAAVAYSTACLMTASFVILLRYHGEVFGIMVAVIAITVLVGYAASSECILKKTTYFYRYGFGVASVGFMVQAMLSKDHGMVALSALLTIELAGFIWSLERDRQSPHNCQTE